MRFGVASVVTTARPPAASYVVSRGSVVSYRFTRRYWFGVTNKASTTLRNLTLYVCEYDVEGYLRAFGSSLVDPLAAGARGSTFVDVPSSSRTPPPPNAVRWLGALL
jgi:hypothetical protein